jgi:tRNA(Ile)-lysidine synthase
LNKKFAWLKDQMMVQLDQKIVTNQMVMLAASGGVDSTALFYLFLQITKERKNFSLALFHVNFGLRGQESEQDQRFVEAMAARHSIPLTVRRVSSQEYKNKGGKSTQEWARDLRYQEFYRLAAKGWTIALAHQMDDCAENVLLRLARGKSPAHLLGMKTFHRPFWRPLLEVPKSVLLEFLHDYGYTYRNDSSNDQMTYSRNRIRHGFLPELESLFPGSSKRLVDFSTQVEQQAEFVHGVLKQKIIDDNVCVPLEWLKEQRDFIATEALLCLIQIQTKSKKPISRGFLNAALEKVKHHPHHLPWTLSIPGTNASLHGKDNKVSVFQNKDNSKEHRYHQHHRSHLQDDQSCILGANVCVTFAKREPDSDQLVKDFTIDGSPHLKTPIVTRRFLPDPYLTLLDDFGQKKKFKTFELLKKNMISQHLLHQWYLVSIDGEMVALINNNIFYKLSTKDLLIPTEVDEIEIYCH